ncbi:restriction endonuclease subunit S [Quisquiliibacterium transsilvanicum]|uniref:Type I restriction enzyme S subunit n=1 Tax=Quisquiliibacterium transsilvanicum TaxID=1549638 RepID=A0A7W8HFR5_9BURK|nr:restriction endonuclease subunit S [Quisquiliibacterium transsilvanicum]MBB5271254.1 type I restriction enzyme S subunit [Quisquiliibacterium transsilvanicum]
MSFPRYPAYKDSGVEWLGEVPEHWAVRPLKYVTALRSGGTPSKDNLDFWDGSIAWASAKDLKRERLDDTEDHITQAAVDAGAAELVPTGAVLVVVRGMILARTFPVSITTTPMAINQDLKALVPFKKVHPAYLARALQAAAEESTRRIDEAGHGTKALRMDAWTSMPLPMPPDHEQALIAAFLDGETTKIDALVAEQEKLIALLQEKRQAVISHAVTKGLDPNVPMKDSGVEWLGKVPEHWSVSPLKSLAEVGNGSTPHRERPEYWTENGYPWLSSTAVNDDFINEADEFVTELALQECHLPKVRPPAVLIGITGQGRTRGMAATLLIEATINQHIAFVRPRAASVHVGYLRRFFDMAYQWMRFESDGVGSTKGAITCEQVAGMRMPVPPQFEQVSIGCYLEAATAKIDALVADAARAINLLKERRAALISAAVTGQIDVCSAVAEPA